MTLAPSADGAAPAFAQIVNPTSDGVKKVMKEPTSTATPVNAAGDARSRRVNRIDNLGTFVRSWNDCAHPRNSESVDLRATLFGNINKTGIPGNYRSHVLSRWHPKFATSLEPGIRELVLLLTEKFKWITYSSCEGHQYADMPVSPVERRVRILPRSRTEADSINAILKSVAAEVNAESRSSAVCASVLSDTVDSELGTLPAIVLCFKRSPSEAWQAYFDLLDSQYSQFLIKLSHLAPL